MRIKDVLDKNIIITNSNSKLFENMIGVICEVSNATQYNTAILKTKTRSSYYLHFETEVPCFVVTKEEHPEYFL